MAYQIIGTLSDDFFCSLRYLSIDTITFLDRVLRVGDIRQSVHVQLFKYKFSEAEKLCISFICTHFSIFRLGGL